MVGQLVQEIFIPAGYARAFTVTKGQVLRLAQVEEKQVADAVFLNVHNFKEVFHAGHTVYLNCIEGTGNLKRVKKLYSKPPRENVMMSVLEDTNGIHFAYIGNRCSRMIYELRDKVAAPPHRSCQDNLAEALAPYGLDEDDVPDVFNVWMNVDIDPERLCFVNKPPTVGHDDYIDLRAEMDLLIAVSACPSDRAPINDYRIKPLKALIYEAES